MKKHFTFVFVCQQGELEIKSLLLAASLKQCLQCQYELVAAIPTPPSQWGSPSEQTLEQLKKLRVRTIAIRNEIDVTYPIANKVACLKIQTTADKLFFLDSDMLCLQDFTAHTRFEIPFNAKPADLATFDTEPKTWQQVYQAMGLEMPSLEIPSTVSNAFGPPYFNAGFIGVVPSVGLGEAWLDCCLKIDAAPGIPDKRPWLDQIALPVALHRLGIDYDCLDERYNYPAHLKRLNDKALPFLCHYHWPQIIRREPILNNLVKDLAKAYPGIAQVMNNHLEWRALLEPYRIKKKHFWQRPYSPQKNSQFTYPELIITGIPRSGTSYLCNLLHRLEDCVILNEPQEIFPPLVKQPIPWGVAAFYRDVRRDILDGKPILNKLLNGRVVEDTKIQDQVSFYTPEVTTTQFVLGSKNTLTYLARLAALRRAMPDAKIIACVRNPFDTIASWKSSFSHLQAADVEKFPVGHPQDPWLTVQQQQSLSYIAKLDNLAQRRAVLWQYLATIILDQRPHILLVHYEELVTDPERILIQIFQQCLGRKYRRLQPVRSTAPRQNREVLDEEDWQAIRGICFQAAAELGINLI